MTSNEIRKKYIEFFKARGHVEIPSSSLVPHNDPTTLFVSAGMQPLITNILGQPHPAGKRLVNSQKAIRMQDIDEVGDNRHTTFFEMLGNWSFGDYFKKEQLPWIFEFLTKELGLPQEKLYVSVFEGTKTVPKDEESVAIWKSLGIVDSRIFYYGVDKNWWSRAGEPDNMPPGEPGGPDSEVFYDFGTSHDPKFGKICHPNCDCGRFMEIANSVFMQYEKQTDGSLKELQQKSVDFGGGLERMTAATLNDSDIFKIDSFFPIINELESLLKIKFGVNNETTKSLRIIADHIKASVFLITEGVRPSNKTQGYILRRLLRRSATKTYLINRNFGRPEFGRVVRKVIEIYPDYFKDAKTDEIASVVSTEIAKFRSTVERGIKIIEKQIKITGKIAFDLYQSYGFPLEVTEELVKAKGQIINKHEFEEEFTKHQELSRTASAGMFKGGLADTSEQTTKLHTAHHLLLASLQKIVDPNIKQRGSNIMAERLRMDVNFARKITPEELKKVEELVNEKITENLPVTRVEMPREEAEKVGAQMEFGHKYPDRVSVYFVGPQKDFFSAECCGGPHVAFTGEIGRLTIIKEESAGAGIRRIYAKV